MVSVRRIAIAVGAVVVPFAAAIVAVLALPGNKGWIYQDDHAGSCVVALLILISTVPRLRRFTPAIVTAFSVVSSS